MALGLYDQLEQQSGMFSPISPFRNERALAKAIGPAVASGRSQEMAGSYNNASNALAAQASMMSQALRGKQAVEAQETQNRGALDLDKQKSKNAKDLVMRILQEYSKGSSDSNFLDDINKADKAGKVNWSLGGENVSGEELSRMSVDDMENRLTAPGGNPTYFAPAQPYENPGVSGAPAFTKSDRSVGASPDQTEDAKRQAERRKNIKSLLQGFMSRDQDPGFDYLQDF